MPREAASAALTASRDFESGTGHARFFARCGPFEARHLALSVGARLVPSADGRETPPLRGVAPLQAARADEISFIDNRRYLGVLASTGAGAVIAAPAFAAEVPPGAAALVTKQPYLAWARIAAMFHPPPAIAPGVHPHACVAGTAKVHADAEIGPFVVVGDAAEVGAGCRIEAHAVLGAGVILGENCRIGAHVSISHALLGNRVVVYPGARIGQDGFGFAAADEGFLSVPQLGRVLIGDEVEIGANATIDRGSAQDTVIGAGLASRQPGADRAQRATWQMLHRRGAGWHLWFDRAWRLRDGRGASWLDRPYQHR